MSTPRPPLALIVATGEPERLRAALTLARCEIALGGAAALFLQGRAVALLAKDAAPADDAAWIAAGEPALGALIREALADGAALTACQSGLAMSGISAQQIMHGVAMGGMIGFLAGLPADARLVMA